MVAVALLVLLAAAQWQSLAVRYLARRADGAQCREQLAERATLRAMGMGRSARRRWARMERAASTARIA